MGLFDKLFSKKETKEKKAERISFDSPHGKFYYTASPSTDEYGYEGYVDWYPNGIEDESTEAYIDTDTPETTEAGQCFARFEKLMSDKERIDYEIKKNAADYFLFKPDLLRGEFSEEDLIKQTDIIWIGLFRNGSTEFLLDAHWSEADDITVVLNADGSKEIKYVAEYLDRFKEFCDRL